MRARLFALIVSVLAGPSLGCSAAGKAGQGVQVASVDPQTGTLGVGPAAAVPGIGAVKLVNLERGASSVDGVRAGRVALVTFWATWCDACEKELGALNRLHERATGEHAVVIGVAVGEPSAKVRGFVERHRLDYAQLVDEDFALTDALEQRSLPATLVVSRTGKVVYKGGALDAEALAAFRKAIAADPVSPP